MTVLVGGLVAAMAAAQTPPDAAQTPPDAAQAQEKNPIAALRTGTALVLVPALVTTKDGKPVFTLTADDFALTDDGVAQPLASRDQGRPTAQVRPERTRRARRNTCAVRLPVFMSTCPYHNPVGASSAT